MICVFSSNLILYNYRERLEEPFKDKLPHLYQLVISPNNTFQISIDHKIVNEGSLMTDFTPPVNPPKEIDDPKDKKPENWDEREKVSLFKTFFFIISILAKLF